MSRQGNLFLAVRPPAGVVPETLLRRLAGVDPAVRTVRPEGVHLTVQFLGPDAPGLAPAVAGSALQVVAGQDRFALRLGGLGCFPSERKPAVIWLGVVAGESSLRQLAGSLGAGLAAAKLPFDGRRFRAHCTLARITGNLSRAALGEIRSLLAADLAGGPFEVSEVCLLESRAVAGEPNRYTVRATLQFGPAVAHISNGRPYQG